MSAWPDPERPGVPLNPERDGWHLVLWRGEYEPRFWKAYPNTAHGGIWTLGAVGPDWHYAGPMPTPPEVAAQVAAAAAPALANLRRLYHHAVNGGTVTARDLSRIIAMLERARGEGGGDAG